MKPRTFDTSQVSALARLFSPSVIRDLASHGRSALFARLVREAGLDESSHDRMMVRDVYDVAFGVLAQRDNRHEYVYKAALTERVLLGKHSLNTARMLTEFRVGDCKADVVIVNGTSAAYEIKSERDSLTRLPHQLRTYLRVFDQAYVITGANHLPSVKALAPPSAGILVLSDRFHISTVREATSNLRYLDSGMMLDSLHQVEAREILVRCRVDVPEAPNTQMHGLLREAFAGIPHQALHAAFVETLKRHRQHRGLGEFLVQVPRSLRAAVLSFRMKTTERERLGDALRVEFDEALAWATA